MTDSEKQELENYRKCVYQIIQLLWFHADEEVSADRLLLVGSIVEVLKTNQIYKKHQPWSYKK